MGSLAPNHFIELGLGTKPSLKPSLQEPWKVEAIFIDANFTDEESEGL